MDKNRIEKEMHELEEKIDHKFNDISLLSKAMCSKKTGSVYVNEGLSVVGDSILKTFLTDKLYRDGLETKGDITIEKSKLENNTVLNAIMKEKNLIDYAYNEYYFHKDENIPDDKKVVDGCHDQYLEAIIAAIFYDKGFNKTSEWILGYLYPLLKEYKVQ